MKIENNKVSEVRQFVQNGKLIKLSQHLRKSSCNVNTRVGLYFRRKTSPNNGSSSLQPLCLLDEQSVVDRLHNIQKKNPPFPRN